MSDDGMQDLCGIEDVSDDRPTLEKDENGHRYAVFRASGEVRALDDRCPHQGYPLSQGELVDGVLTCAWHNWKFDGCTGDCSFGGEAVRSYPVRIVDGRVLVDTTLDVSEEKARLLRSMDKTLREVDVGSALRDALRLSRLFGDGPGQRSAFEAIVGDGARRAPWGFDHALAMTADLARWAEDGWIDGSAAVALSVTAVAEERANLGQREIPGPDPVGPEPDEALFDDLVHEQRASAEARTRRLARERGTDAAIRALMPFVALHNLDYGHGAIFAAKTVELARRFPEHAEDLFGALAVSLCWATRETSLPPWAATRGALEALAELATLGDGSIVGDVRRDYEGSVLEGERPAVERTVALLGEGVSPVALLRVTARAAARRVFRFDAAWERRRDAQVSALAVSHTLTFTESALALAPLATAAQLARLAVLAAAFVGKVKKGDAPTEPRAALGVFTLEDGIRRRDVSIALGAVRGLDRVGRANAFRTLADHAAFDFATRPIRYAHAIKMTEALYRLDRDDHDGDGTHLDALIAFVVPRRPERDHRRIAEVATRFLDDPRPPPGLY